MGYGNGYAGSPIPTAPTVLPFYRLLYAITGSYTLLPVLLANLMFTGALLRWFLRVSV